VAACLPGPQASQNWFLKSARDAELELDDELAREEEEGSGKDKQRAAQVAQDRKRLTELLAQPLTTGEGARTHRNNTTTIALGGGT
jgi:hypothetical protein